MIKWNSAINISFYANIKVDSVFNFLYHKFVVTSMEAYCYHSQIGPRKCCVSPFHYYCAGKQQFLQESMRAQRWFRSVCACAKLICFSFSPEGALDPELPKACPAKTLMPCEDTQMSTNNICFHKESQKDIVWVTLDTPLMEFSADLSLNTL